MPILDANSFEFLSRSPDQTRRVGMRLGALLKDGDVLCLDGDLGAGKTTLVQGMAAGWGSIDPVSSPTFVLVNVYRRSDGQRFAHLDAYRLSGPSEAEELDLDALIAGGPLVVEWAPRIQAALPKQRLSIGMEWVQEEYRQMNFSAEGERYREMLESFEQNMFGGGD
jgi:tRNA threonylcarbamoyladenosine biosynthesis protein TsaE